MNNYQFEKEESILFEGKVKIERFKKEVKLSLTSKNMYFEKEKGLFRKKLKLVDMISLADIKVYKEKVQVTQKEEQVMIQTIDKNINLSCASSSEAKQIAKEIINIKAGSTFSRASKKISKFAKSAGINSESTKKLTKTVLVSLVTYFLKKKIK